MICTKSFILLFFLAASHSFATGESSAVAAAQLATDAQSISAKKNVEQNKEYSKFPEEIDESCTKLQSRFSTDVKTFCTNTVKPKATDCNANYIPAGDTCNPDTNGDLLQKTALIQTLLSTAQGLTDSCSVFSKAMDIGKIAMSAYSAYCGTLRQLCENACSSSSGAIKELAEKSELLIKNIESAYCMGPRPDPDPDEIECQKANNVDIPALKVIIAKSKEEIVVSAPKIGGKLKACKIDMTTLVGMGLANIGALAQSKAMSDQCEKDTKSNTAAAAVDCTKPENSTKAECANAVVDCGLATNADKPVCICKANPRIKGCEGVSTSLATNSTLSTGGSGSTSGKGLNTPGGSLTAATDKKFPANLATASKNDGSGGSGFGGGSSAGLTGSSDGTSNPESQLAKNGTTANANILGTESGGGGGYRFGFGSGSSTKASGRGLATSDRVKGKLSAMDWSNQVTSNAGKSNFDKIKVRYNENRTSLLNR